MARRARPVGPQRWRAAAVIRWPAVLVIAAIVAAIIAVQASTDDGSSAASNSGRRLGVAVGDPEALASTWYCAGGTIAVEGFADHHVVLANPGDRDAVVSVSVVPVIVIDQEVDDALETDDLGDVLLPAPEAVVGEVQEVRDVVPARSITTIRLADVEGVVGEYAAALVESDAGDLLVEHRITGPSGSTVAPCASASSSEWHFAAGSSRAGARQVLAVYNPFPGDAVVDIAIRVDDGGVRTPGAYEALVIPSGVVVPVEISDVVTLFDVTGVSVVARSGRVVVDRIVEFDGSEGVSGLALSPGAPSVADQWVLPGGPGDGATAVVIANPSDDIAQVDVEIRPDPAAGVVIEPIGVTVQAGRMEVVVVTPGSENVTAARTVGGTGRLAPGIPFGRLVVRRVRGSDVVVDRFTVPAAGAPRCRCANRSQQLAVDGVLLDHARRPRRAWHSSIRPATGSRWSRSSCTAEGSTFVGLAPVELAGGDRTELDFADLGVPGNSMGHPRCAAASRSPSSAVSTGPAVRSLVERRTGVGRADSGGPRRSLRLVVRRGQPRSTAGARLGRHDAGGLEHVGDRLTATAAHRGTTSARRLRRRPNTSAGTPSMP